METHIQQVVQSAVVYMCDFHEHHSENLHDADVHLCQTA